MNNETERDLMDWYTKEADTYEYKRFEDSRYPANLRLVRKIKEVCIKYLVGTEIFEIACGTGYWGNFFSSIGFTYSGIDITPNMIKVAHRKGRITCKVGKVEDPKAYPKGTDNIVCIKAFTMFQDKGAVLRNSKGALRPGGRLLLFYNNRWNLLYFIYALLKGKKKVVGDGYYDVALSRPQVTKQLREAGFRLVLVKDCCNIPFRFLPQWKWLDKLDDLLSFGWITCIVAEKE